MISTSCRILRKVRSQAPEMAGKEINHSLGAFEDLKDFGGGSIIISDVKNLPNISLFLTLLNSFKILSNQ